MACFLCASSSKTLLPEVGPASSETLQSDIFAEDLLKFHSKVMSQYRDSGSL